MSCALEIESEVCQADEHMPVENECGGFCVISELTEPFDALQAKRHRYRRGRGEGDDTAYVNVRKMSCIIVSWTLDESGRSFPSGLTGDEYPALRGII